MKTIDVVLETADEYLEYAVINHNDEKRALFSAIAQAAAQTAQAMIMHAQAQDIAVNNERAELRELWHQ